LNGLDLSWPTASNWAADLSDASAVVSKRIWASNWRAAAIMPTMVSIAFTFEPSSAPVSRRAVLSLGTGSCDAVRNKPSSLRFNGSSCVGVASFRRPNVDTGWLPVFEVTVPSLPMLISPPGGTSIGEPPSDKMTRPELLTSVPVDDTCSAPERL